MSSIWRSLFGVVVAALLAAPGSGRADMKGVAAGPTESKNGAIRLKHEDIRLDALEVTLKLKKTHYVVYGTFHFFNTGETKTGSVPFGEPWKIFPMVSKGDSRLERVDTWVNEKKMGAPEDSPWMLKEVPFPGHKATTIRVRYEADYATIVGDKNKRCVIYPLGPTGIWKDLIGRAVYTVDGSDLGGIGHFSCSLIIHYRAAGTKGHDVLSRKETTKDLVRYEVRDFWPFSTDALRACLTTEEQRR